MDLSQWVYYGLVLVFFVLATIAVVIIIFHEVRDARAKRAGRLQAGDSE